MFKHLLAMLVKMCDFDSKPNFIAYTDIFTQYKLTYCKDELTSHSTLKTLAYSRGNLALTFFSRSLY